MPSGSAVQFCATETCVPVLKLPWRVCSVPQYLAYEIVKNHSLFTFPVSFVRWSSAPLVPFQMDTSSLFIVLHWTNLLHISTDPYHPLPCFSLSLELNQASSAICYLLISKEGISCLNECWQANSSQGHKNLTHLTAFDVSVQYLFTCDTVNDNAMSQAMLLLLGIYSVSQLDSYALLSCLFQHMKSCVQEQQHFYYVCPWSHKLH